MQMIYFTWLPYELFFLKERYQYFTVEWYADIGFTISLICLMFLVTPHLSNIGTAFIVLAFRFMDRGNSWDARRTQKLKQEEYETINHGPEFLFEYRYSNLLKVLAVVFLYSYGIPILYFLAAIYFILTYWVDKVLILRYYKRPIMFDALLAENTLAWFKWILAVHVFGTMIMHGYSPIMRQDIFVVLEDVIKCRWHLYDDQDRFDMLYFYCIIIYVCLLVYIFIRIILPPLKGL